MNTINERIKLVRKDNNLTQKQFADRILVTQSYLSRLESGKEMPNDKLIKLIALEFDVPTGWLETGIGSQSIDENSFDYYVRGNNEIKQEVAQKSMESFAVYLKELNNEVINMAASAVVSEMKGFLEETTHLTKSMQMNTFEQITNVMLSLCVELKRLSPDMSRETFNSIAWNCSSHLTKVLLELKDIYFATEKVDLEMYLCPDKE